jgi:hypothetical protein
MDKEKIAKLQAQIRIGMFTVVKGDETDTMPSFSIRHTIPYIYLLSIIYPSTIHVSPRSTINLRLAPFDNVQSLAALAISQTGGKGTPRRKVVKKSQASSQGDDRKLQAALKKLNVTQIAGVEEVNMFKDDGNVLHFASPRGESVFLL